MNALDYGIAELFIFYEGADSRITTLAELGAIHRQPGAFFIDNASLEHVGVLAFVGVVARVHRLAAHLIHNHRTVEAAVVGDQLGDGSFDGRVALVEEVGELLRVTVDAEDISGCDVVREEVPDDLLVIRAAVFDRTMFGRPTAATTISALLTTSDRSLVRL